MEKCLRSRLKEYAGKINEAVDMCARFRERNSRFKITVNHLYVRAFG